MPAAGAVPAQPQMGQYRMQTPGQYAPGEAPERKSHFETELEINDFPQHARWKVGFVYHSPFGDCGGISVLSV